MVRIRSVGASTIGDRRYYAGEGNGGVSVTGSALIDRASPVF